MSVTSAILVCAEAHSETMDTIATKRAMTQFFIAWTSDIADRRFSTASASRAGACQKNEGSEDPPRTTLRFLLPERVAHAAVVEPSGRIGKRRIVADLERIVLAAVRRILVEQVLDAEGERKVLEAGVLRVQPPNAVGADVATESPVRTRCILIRV